MKVSELMEQLSLTELSNHSMSVEGSGAIKEEKQPAIISHLNDGLVRLHTRFRLAHNSVLLRQVGHITSYHLNKQFSQQHGDPSKEPFLYIEDTPGEPYAEDAIKIVAVHNHLGDEYPLNDDARPDSLFTPKPLMLQVPRPCQGMGMSVMYQALHPRLLGTKKQDEEVELPTGLYEALRSYVAYKVWTNMNNQDAKATAQEHLGNYEAICKEIEEHDHANSSSTTTNKRFKLNGWV